MTDITELWTLIPSKVAILHNIIFQCIKLDDLAKLVEQYLIVSLNMTYNTRTKEIELSTPITFTLCKWNTGRNCNISGVKCIYPHDMSLFCVRFLNSKESNIEAYRIGMKLLFNIIMMNLPSLGVARFKERIDVITEEAPTLNNIHTIDSCTIMCTNLHVSGSIIHPNWNLLSSTNIF